MAGAFLYCPSCGAPRQGFAFCGRCGTDLRGAPTLPPTAPLMQPSAVSAMPAIATAPSGAVEGRRRSGPAKTAVLLLAVAIVAGAAGAVAGHQLTSGGSTSAGLQGAPATRSPGFATPEAAATAYVQAFARQDVSGLLATAAIDEMASGYQFSAVTDRLNAMMPTQFLAPSTNAAYIATNRAYLTSGLLRQELLLGYSLLSSEAIDGSPITPANSARADAFVAAVDPSRLAGLTIVEIGSPYASKVTQQVRDGFAKGAATYGADDRAERVVLLSLGGKTFMLGLQLIRYGNDWKVQAQGSALAGTSSWGTAAPMSREEFDALING